MRLTARSNRRTRHADRPTLICCKTMIGKGSPNRAGHRPRARRRRSGEKEVALTREAIGWTYPPFEIPQTAYDGWNAANRGARLRKRLGRGCCTHTRAHSPRMAAEFDRRMAGSLPADFRQSANAVRWSHSNTKAETIATRKASQQAIESLAPTLPELIGGSADLTGSVFTNWSASSVGDRDQDPGQLH